jgi:hypothetical protein
MLNRRNLIALATIAAAALAQPAFAADTKPFTQAAFNAAQAAGKPILVEITAPGAPSAPSKSRSLHRSPLEKTLPASRFS